VCSDLRLGKINHPTVPSMSEQPKHLNPTKEQEMRIQYRSRQQTWRTKDEASQELFFACISFVILLGVALADVVFTI
jgi:hypothetical protein